ncbi:hypothetical protein EIP91_008510 [Steccherinum ochraceum]|uniref:C2H2-type domain-containing protein n=1 Tax=Steccherinum ochraceum TaxID=92696 RepID=A0A4R0R536_9APHY|nr:hypothetical protein EIP91_008510 [Steccherinum ochraceum]
MQFDFLFFLLFFMPTCIACNHKSDTRRGLEYHKKRYCPKIFKATATPLAVSDFHFDHRNIRSTISAKIRRVEGDSDVAEEKANLRQVLNQTDDYHESFSPTHYSVDAASECQDAAPSSPPIASPLPPEDGGLRRLPADLHRRTARAYTSTCAPSQGAGGVTDELLGASIIRNPSDDGLDWVLFYVNMFVDRDMFMRFLGGAVGHCKLLGQAFSSSQIQAKPLQEEDLRDDDDNGDMAEPANHDLDVEDVDDDRPDVEEEDEDFDYRRKSGPGEDSEDDKSGEDEECSEDGQGEGSAGEDGDNDRHMEDSDGGDEDYDE